MGKLIVLVLMVGSMGLFGIALVGFLRFLLLAYLVQVLGSVVRGALGLIKAVLHALIFVFGTALVGAFIVGFGLQIIMTLAAGGGTADPTMPVLIAFLVFFVLLAWRGWQWQARRNRPNTSEQSTLALIGLVEEAEQVEYPAGYETVADAWRRAIRIAPERRNDLVSAELACAELLTAVAQHDGIPDGEVMETVVLIRNHLAALVDSTERRLRSASPAQKIAAIAEMVKFLLGFGQRARQVIEAAGFGPGSDDEALRAHLAARLFCCGFLQA